MSTFISNIETASDHTVVWFSEAGQAALKTNAAELVFGEDHYTVQWTDGDGEDHEVQYDCFPDAVLGLEAARRDPGFTVIDHIRSYAAA